MTGLTPPELSLMNSDDGAIVGFWFIICVVLILLTLALLPSAQKDAKLYCHLCNAQLHKRCAFCETQTPPQWVCDGCCEHYLDPDCAWH
jgi:hypothetical protein